jgi:lysozyme
MASKPPNRKGAAAALLAVMVAIAAPVYVGWEGTRTLPYKDIVGVWTVCSGDTRNVVPGKRLTDAECDRRTGAILEEYGSAVAASSPGIDRSPYEWAAHTIFAANVGVGAYRRSTVRKLYNEGKHRQACRFIREYRNAGGKPVTGLINRRNGTDARVGEYELCLVGAIPADA